MKGIIVFYIDVHPECNQETQQVVDLMVRINQPVLDRIKADGDYQVIFVPTTKEACRVEKIDFDKPYPRFLPKTHGDIGEFDRRKAERLKQQTETQ